MLNKRELIAAVDAGTTGTRCCIFDSCGNLISGGYYPVPSIYPKPGIVEQDPEIITDLTFRAVKEAMSYEDVDPRRIVGLCMSVQRNSFVPIGPKGEFLSNMIIWQDQRGEEAHPWIRDRLRHAGLSLQDFYSRNGQPFSSFQCGFKALWLRRFREDLYRKAWKLVTPQVFLARAFGAEGYIEENTNQSFWLVADADRQEIDEELCGIFDFRSSLFPETAAPGTLVGTVSHEAAERSGLLAGTPIYLGVGDQQCGALGAGNYGTSDIISICMGTAGLCIGYSPVPVRHPGAACQIQGHPVGGYLIESHSSSCMSSYRWAGDLLFRPYSDLRVEERGPRDRADIHEKMEKAAKAAPVGAKGVFFLPWLQGAACPHYNDAARGAYIGMSLASGKNELMRATVEGICFENRMMLETLLEADIARPETIRTVGGASNSEFWNQIQADIYGIPLETITAKEASALGAAIVCAVAAGLYEDYRIADGSMVHVLRRYVPDKECSEEYNRVYPIWDTCYQDLSRNSFREIYRYQTFT